LILLWLACLALVSLQTGCSFHYYDKATGTDHLWGFGHLKMKVNPATNGCLAFVKGCQCVGLGLHLGAGESALSLGLDSHQHLMVYHEDALLELSWPTNRLAPDFAEFEVKVRNASALTNHLLTPTNAYENR
jgi:hypothetical protein